MENNNNLRFNPSRYEEHLSTFGRKVLTVLVRNLADQNNCNQSAYQKCHNTHRPKRVMTFKNEVSPRPTPPLFNEIPTEHESADFVRNFVDPNSAEAPKIIELVHTVENANVITFPNVNLSSDLINPVINGNDNMHSWSTSVDLLLHSEGQLMENANDRTEKEKINDIDWDDMFDTELLSDSTTTNVEHVENKSDIEQANEGLGSHKESVKMTDKNSNKLKKQNKTKKTKGKSPLTENSKKVKKIGNDIKPNMRKQKYTKAIKNWLDDIAANKPEKDKETDNSIKSNNKKSGTEVIIEKVKGKSNKKVIQAQLTNKGGKMKFDKPKTEPYLINNENGNKIEKALNMDTVTNDTDNKSKIEKETNKKMKQKSKFVAPIKSQIPVKDMEYKLIIVNGDDEKHKVKMFSNVNNKELVAVLVYGNGFCQLNNQHTDDSCEPEGVLLTIDDDFYYFKGFHEFNGKFLAHLTENNKVICYEGKALLIYFKSKFDLDINKIDLIDAKIGGSLIDPDSPPENFSDLQKLLSFTAQFTIATECILQKTAWYTSLLRECCTKLVSLLKEQQLWHVFVEIEMKLLPIIAEMERVGITVDLQKLKSMEDILLTKMKATELACHKAAGKVFQVNSPVQVRAIIYDELQLDTKSNIKIKETLNKGAKSTSETMAVLVLAASNNLNDQLRSLVSVHPLPKLILEYRHLHKAHATFLSGIAQFVEDGVVRPTWVQMAAATGRIASNNPNLQAIPKAPFELVLFPEDNSAETPSLRFRSVYESRAGHSLVAADFQHIECRVFALAAADDRLGAALRSGRDLFRALAADWLQKAERSVTDVERERTKRVVYASLYGAGCTKLMHILGVTYEQARDVLASFHRTFPSLKSFGECVVRRCVSCGGRVTTASGRARSLPHVASADAALRAHAERQAVNLVIQGSAADACKTAMWSTCGELRAAGVRAALLLQIHDELVWELPDTQLHRAAAIIKRVMENCGLQCGLNTLLPVSISTGKNWGDMTPYTAP